MIGIIQTGRQSRTLECSYDGKRLAYRVTAEVLPYVGHRPKAGALHVLAEGFRSCAPGTVADHVDRIAHYWQAQCYLGGRLVADYRAPGEQIHRYEGPRCGFPYAS